MASLPPMYKHKHSTTSVQKVDMYTLQTEAASLAVFPFVQCELVAPLVVDGSHDSVSPLVVWGLMVSQVGG